MLGSYSFQWLKNAKPINGATALSYKAKTKGNYSVLVTDVKGCSRISSIFKVTTNCKFSDGNLNYIDQLSLQPNPVIDQLEVNFSLIAKSDLVITIYDLTGRKVYTEFFDDSNGGENNITIDVAQLNTGIYQLEVSDVNSNFKSFGRFIKN